MNNVESPFLEETPNNRFISRYANYLEYYDRQDAKVL